MMTPEKQLLVVLTVGLSVFAIAVVIGQLIK
jgi:hypothetical protein